MDVRFYVFVVGYAMFLYLLSVILFPDDLGEYSGFRDYFYARRRWFLGYWHSSS